MKWVKLKEAEFKEFLDIPGLKSKTSGVFCVNIIIGGCKKRDIISLFSPDKHTEFIRVGQNVDWAQLLGSLKVFPSISRARKNGWNKPIPMGFSDELVAKKQQKAVFVFKQPPSRWQQWVEWFKKWRKKA